MLRVEPGLSACNVCAEHIELFLPPLPYNFNVGYPVANDINFILGEGVPGIKLRGSHMPGCCVTVLPCFALRIFITLAEIILDSIC